jgi:hypothetical protein
VAAPAPDDFLEEAKRRGLPSRAEDMDGLGMRHVSC